MKKLLIQFTLLIMCYVKDIRDIQSDVNVITL